ncbi:MAG: hypothetical protein ACXABY_05725 [Candidatus Thorarchaeota archaeon]
MADVMMYYSGGGDAKIIGPVTHATYWFYIGQPTPVAEEDVEELLKKTRKGACCGKKKIHEVKLFNLM